MGNSESQNEQVTVKAKTGKILRLLLTPINIGRLRLKNRIVMTPIVTGVSPAGKVEQRHKDYYAGRARGGAALIMVEPGAVDIATKGMNLGLYEDQFVPGLKELVEVVHNNGAFIGIQLWHGGRQYESRYSGYPLVAPSPLPWKSTAEVPKELSIEEIKQLVEKFAEAAKRVKAAGFDLVEVHAAHGYLLSEFLSPLSNKRTDEYGGDLQQRARFVIEIIKRIRQVLGDSFPISCRINGADNVVGGFTVENAKTIAPLLVEAGLNVISISAGVFGSVPTIVPAYYAPRGCNVHLAEVVKSVVNVPVVAAGRINDPWLAEEILAAGRADLIGMGRSLLVDPELPNKALRGEFEGIRKCIACNVCQDTSVVGLTTCTVNPALGREKEFEIIPAPRAKKVLVIGGGLAGLEAARVAALRGHQVTLYEEDSELGGQWRLAATPPGKQEFLGLLDYLSNQVRKLGVSLELGKVVTPAEVGKQKPDVVIVATGAEPLFPSISGVERKEVVTAWDVLQKHVLVGNKVLIVGGGNVGLETADFLAEQKKKVVIVEMLNQVGEEMPATVRWHLLHRLSERGVKIFSSTKVKKLGERAVVIIKKEGEETWEGFDTIVLATGTQSRDEIADEIRGKVKEIYIIGDAARPRKGLDAIREGVEIGRMI